MPTGSKENPNNQPLTGSVIIDGTSYSGADIRVTVQVYDRGHNLDGRIQEIQEEAESSTDPEALAALQDELEAINKESPIFVAKTLAECQTLSVSSYREKYPVRSLGTVYPKGYTRGGRMIAGSMVFTVFNKNVLYDILAADPSDFDVDNHIASALIDQLPPMDVSIIFANEVGQMSRMSIYGVEFVSEGQTMSIQDLFIENQTQYVARDYDPMTSTGEGRRDQNNRITGQELKSTTASALLKSPEGLAWKNLRDPFSRFKSRNNPFR